MSRPLVGICTAVDRARFGPWDQVAMLLPRTYVRAVEEAGGTSILLPPGARAADSPGEMLDRIDALVIAGGYDLDPRAYDAPAHPTIDRPWPERDRAELALARAAVERGMPVLGICRGSQTLNVALGGTLVQHLPELTGDERHRPAPGTFGEHEVRLEAGSLAVRAAGAERVAVKSHHHQGFDRLGEGLVASGWAMPDGIVEAIELPDRDFVLGVLWHPEEDEGSRVLAALVDAA